MDHGSDTQKFRQLAKENKHFDHVIVSELQTGASQVLHGNNEWKRKQRRVKQAADRKQSQEDLQCVQHRATIILLLHY